MSPYVIIMSYRLVVFNLGTEVAVCPEGVTSTGPQLFYYCWCCEFSHVMERWLPDLLTLWYLVFPAQFVGRLGDGRFESVRASCRPTIFHNRFSVHWFSILISCSTSGKESFPLSSPHFPLFKCPCGLRFSNPIFVDAVSGSLLYFSSAQAGGSPHDRVIALPR